MLKERNEYLKDTIKTLTTNYEQVQVVVQEAKKSQLRHEVQDTAVNSSFIEPGEKPERFEVVRDSGNGFTSPPVSFKQAMSPRVNTPFTPTSNRIKKSFNNEVLQ